MKKILTISALLIAPLIFSTKVDAFGGQRGFSPNITQEQFEELKTLIAQHSDFSSFKEALIAKIAEKREAFKNMTEEERQAFRKERQGERNKFRESYRKIDRSVEKISNGVVLTITSTDSEVVTKIQEREKREHPKRENIERNIKLIENGVEITITSDDTDIVERIQNHKPRQPRHSRHSRRSQIRNQFEKGAKELFR
jgi:TusA-related sulfurtransferase